MIWYTMKQILKTVSTAECLRNFPKVAQFLQTIKRKVAEAFNHNMESGLCFCYLGIEFSSLFFFLKWKRQQKINDRGHCF